MTEINVKEKMKQQPGLDMRKYMIQCVYNPLNGDKAILAEGNIGLMLPCDVTVYDENSKTVLSVSRPTSAMEIIDNAELKKVVETVEDKLKKAFDAVK